MELAPDITAEDLQVFLQEAEEHLQLLDEDIVRLEREGDNQELLQEIFRSAHTLKGSSAMLGHQRMTALAHVMETLLDLVRKGAVEVTTQVADALLHALDALTLLKEELLDENAPETDVTAVVDELERAIVIAGSGHESGASENLDTEVVLTEEKMARLAFNQESGRSVFEVLVSFDPSGDWSAVRCFQALEMSADFGEVLGANPTHDDIAAERVGHEIRIVLATAHSEDDLRTGYQGLDDLETVEIGPFTSQKAPHPAPAPAPLDLSEAAPAVAAPAAVGAARQAGRANQSQTVRIDVERLDHMMNMIGELIIDRTRIVQISKGLDSQYADDELVQSLNKTSEHIGRVVDELQQSTMQVRMQPIGTVFNGFPRMLRDLAQKVNKKIKFIVDGQDTEIDRTVIDRIRDPLVHLLRNSLDHGIETPEERVALGKPEEGNIWLSAYHEQGHIVIQVRDDGRGIDREKIKSSVVSKGLMSAEAASRLNDAEALDLIFLPGSSTAEKTTDISGRGVGMDIVKSNISAIHGFMTVDTEMGKGTTLTLSLPLTLATLQAMLVSVKGTFYAVPLVYVLEAVMRKKSEISTFDGDKEIIRLRGDVVPLLRLGSVMGLDPEDSDDQPRTRIKAAETGEDEQIWVVIVRFGDKLVGLAVDQLTELQEIVVKSLGGYIGDVKGIAGASVLGDGRIVLILDIMTLMNVALQRSQTPAAVG